MANIEILQPISQPSGTFRLLDWLNRNFSNTAYHSFRCLVAFAKVKPLYKMHENIQKWNALGNQTEAIIGIDHKGTSVQALQYALENFRHTYVLHAEHATFHPKMYIFSGDTEAAVYYGSSNLTPGGLETNFEGGILLTLTLPGDADLLHQANMAFESLLPSALPCCVELSDTVLQQLNDADLLLDETVRRPKRASGAAGRTPIFPSYRPKPPRAIPRAALASTSAGTSATPAVGAVPLVVDGLIMQVTPHRNGEILLSKIAINQNPGFFGFPFTGRTTPKKAANPTYPQREPDPVVNIYVYDSTGICVHTETKYNLNTVYYEAKAEVRITITPAILDGLSYSGGTDYPIMRMCHSEHADCDYDLHFYAQGSGDYAGYLAVCDQTLPSGGKTAGRKMGWI